MRKLYIILIAGLLILALIVPVGSAYAKSPQKEVTGDVTLIQDGYPEGGFAGNSTVLKTSISFNTIFTGDLEDTGHEDLNGIVNFAVFDLSTIPPVIDVKVTHSSGLEVVGRGDDTMTLHVNHIQLGNGDFKVIQTIISGTGEYANTHGTLHYMVGADDPSGNSYSGTYSGKLHESNNK